MEKSSSTALFTDLYQLTMAYGYWKNGLADLEAVFHLNFRKPPFHGGFTIAAGLDPLIKHLQEFTFDASDIEYLRTLTSTTQQELFSEDFFDYLKQMRFSCHIDAVPEGSVVFPNTPLLRIQGPIIQCQLLESAILNIINFSTLIATKAARICIAAKGEPVLEFGLRRAQGVDGALTASRAAFIGGCSSTSNVLAGKIYGIPVRGTHSHSWVMVFDDELEAFKKFADTFPDDCVFLVDTYNSIQGVEHAITVAKELKALGHQLQGIRLDSGDLAYLSIAARQMLDEAGFPEVKIMASNELDETIISELKRQGAKITVWGVGTNLVTARDQPALDGVYKLSAIRKGTGQWQYKLKLSEQLLKISTPGILQVRRYHSSQENVGDVIYDTQIGVDSSMPFIDPYDPTHLRKLSKDTAYKDLLVPVFREGQLVYPLPNLSDIRTKTMQQLNEFTIGIKRFIYPHTYPVAMEKRLYDIKVQMIQNARAGTSYSY